MSDDIKPPEQPEDQTTGTDKPFGRPTDYRPEYCQELIKHMKDGNSFWSFAAKVGTCFKTLGNWTKAHGDFLQAKKTGEALLLAFDEELAKAGTAGQLERRSKIIRRTIKHKDGRVENIEEEVFESAAFSASYHRFMMRNRWRGMYADKLIVDTAPAKTTQATDEIKKLMASDPAVAAVMRKLAKATSGSDSENNSGT